jgi:hypothetical protein
MVAMSEESFCASESEEAIRAMDAVRVQSQ